MKESTKKVVVLFFLSNLMLTDIQNVKLLRAKARGFVGQQEKSSWRHFCSKVDSKTQTQKVWRAIGGIRVGVVGVQRRSESSPKKLYNLNIHLFTRHIKCRSREGG